MKKLLTKVIAIVLVIAISASMVVMSTSAYSAIAGIVDIVHILTDLKVTDGIISDITKIIGKAGVKSFVDMFKLIIKSGVDIDDLVDMLHKITDKKVTDAPDFGAIADAIIGAAKNKGLLDKDALVDFLKILNDLPLDADTLADFIKGILGSIDFGDSDFDLDKIVKVFSAIIDALKGNIGGGVETPDIEIPDLSGIIGKLDASKFLELFKGLMDKDIDFDGLKALFKNLCPDVDFDDAFIKDLLDKIKGGTIDLPTLKDIFTRIGIPDINTDILSKILDFLKQNNNGTPDLSDIIKFFKDLLGNIGGGDVEVPDVEIPDIDIDNLFGKYDIQKLLDFLNGLMNKDMTLPDLEKLFKDLNPDIKLDNDFLKDLLDKIKGGNIDLPTLKDIFTKLDLPELDNSILLKILDFIKNGTKITLPDLKDILGGLGGELDIEKWLKDFFDKFGNKDNTDDPVDPSDPADPSDPTDPSDKKESTSDPKTDEVLEDVEIIDDLISNPENTPLGVTDSVPLDSIAQTGDAGIAAAVSVTVLAAAAFVAAKKKED